MRPASAWSTPADWWPRRTSRLARRCGTPACPTASWTRPSAPSWRGCSSRRSCRPPAGSWTWSCAASCAVSRPCRPPAWAPSPSSSRARCRTGASTSAPEAAALVPGVVAPASKASTTWYHLADVPPDALVEGRPVLTLDGDGTGPISSTVPLSHVSASYASGGRVLVTSLAVGERGSADDERAARTQLAALYGEATGGWDHVATYVVPHSLPAMPPPHDFRRPVVVTDGLYVCGDHRDSASQQGAMVSGRRAAESILAAARTSSAPA